MKNNVDQLRNLDSLCRKFNPKRIYEYNSCKIEVDGAMMRVDEDIHKNINQETGEAVIKLEDLLQDVSIIRSARVSTGRDSKAIDERAANLIKVLYDDIHETPFEGGVMFRLKITIPICYAQPFFQIFASHNELSGRYSIIDGEFLTPAFVYKNTKAKEIFAESEKDSEQTYHELLNLNVATEQARFALLFRFFTKFYMTISLRHILEFLSLESNNLAPKEFWEIRDNIFPEILKDWAPWTYNVWQNSNRRTKTKWHRDHEEEINKNLVILKIGALDYANVEKVGKIWLLHSSEFTGTDEIFKVGVQTKPSPRRGFGHASMTFLIEVPIFTHRQWVRHRYGTWTELPVDFDRIVLDGNLYIPEEFRQQIGESMGYAYKNLEKNKNAQAHLIFSSFVDRCISRYKELRNIGLTSEHSGMVLPYVFRINTIWTANLESLMNYFSLRCDKHAQWETKQYANQIYIWFKKRFGFANEVFLKNLNFGDAEIFT